MRCAVTRHIASSVYGVDNRTIYNVAMLKDYNIHFITDFMKSILCTLLIATSVVAFAQEQTQSKNLVDIQRDSLVASHKIITIGDQPKEKSQGYADSVRHLIENFYYDQFRHFQDPDAPYFLFMSRDAQLAMGIGGAVRMRGYFDWDGAIMSPAFAPYLIPMEPDPTKMRNFNTTPAGTCLFFRVIGRNKTIGNYQLYIEANFNGYQTRDFHLKKAYAIVNDFTIGYANSTFSDPAAQPATVDAQGPANKISPTAVLVRWMPTFKKKWVAAVSLETPSNSITTDSTTSKVNNWIPDAVAFIQYQWDKSSHVRLSGIVRALSYRDLLTEKNHYKAGWAVMLSSVAHPTTFLTTYATINYGRGYESFINDLTIGAYDLIPDYEHPGVLKSPASFGWCLGLQYNIRHNLFVSTSFSQTRFLPNVGVEPTEYRYGLTGNINVFWNLTPRMQVAAEFDYGMRKNFNGESRWAKRIGLMAQFSF